MPLRAVPLWRDTDATVDTTGVAYDLQASSTHPIHATQVKVYVSEAAYVGVGRTSSPPTASADNTVYQEAATEEVYTFSDNQNFTKYLYVYAVTGTITAVRVSAFG